MRMFDLYESVMLYNVRKRCYGEWQRKQGF